MQPVLDAVIPAALVVKARKENIAPYGPIILGVDPVRDDEGKTYTHKLEAGDNPKQIAGLLTKKFRKVRRGNNAAPHDFSAPIAYPKTGWL